MSYTLPSWVMEHIPQTCNDFIIHSTPPDGNCFFKSIQIILNSVNMQRTILQLRHIVGKNVLNENDEFTNKTIKSWLELYQAAYKERNMLLLEEYRHLKGLEETNFPLEQKERKILYDNMMTSDFWGEEDSLRIIEQQTQMRLLIFNGDLKKPALSWYHSINFKPSHYCFLYLSRQHYSPISYKGRFIFKWEDLPYEVKYFFTQAYKQTNQ